MTEAAVRSCGICGGPLRFDGLADYRHGRSGFETTIYSCRSCDVYRRELRDEQLVTHFAEAGYAQLENESRFRNARQNFFRFILEVVAKHLRRNGGGPPLLVDVGSAYGHLLELAERQGYKAVGWD